MGRGSAVGDALIGSSRVDGISFTGSVTTGKRDARKAVERLARIQLEMGGKNPLVVLDDADLDVAVNCAVQGAFFSTGQRCTASSRLIVTEGIHDRFVGGDGRRMEKLTVGDALKAGTEIGPVVDQSQLEQDSSTSTSAGRKGRSSPGAASGSSGTQGLLSPARALHRDHQRDARQPRGDLRPGRDGDPDEGYDEALAVANDTDFGLRPAS